MNRILTRHKRRGPANWKTSSQLLTVYVLAVFLPLVVIGSYLISTVSKVQKNYYADMLTTNNAGVKQTLYEITYQIFTASDSIVYNDSLIAFKTSRISTSSPRILIVRLNGCVSCVKKIMAHPP